MKTQQHEDEDDAQSGAPVRAPAPSAPTLDDADAAFIAQLNRLGGGRSFVKARGATIHQLIRLRSAGLIELVGEAIAAQASAKITPRGLVALAAHPGIIKL